MAMRPSDFMQRNPVKIDISRSKFHMQPRWTGDFNAYELCPILTYIDVLPGDTFKLSTSFVIRMSTPVAPVMDDLFLDVAFYFVPHKLILSRSYMSPSVDDSNHSWKAFIGAQDSKLNMPIPDGDIELPHFLISPANVGAPGSRLTDRMGISPGSFAYRVNCLPILAFMAVWNENYREPNVQEPGVFSIDGDSLVINWRAAFGDSDNHDGDANMDLPNVCRLHGYFGSALPWPQRNSETVKMPLGIAAPLKADGDRFHSFGGNLQFFETGGLDSLPGSTYGVGGFGQLSVKNTEASYSDGNVQGSNLIVDLAQASAVSINTFRLAVQEQRWYEALARGGNRLDELTAALFGVMPKDAGGDQPEYLGGKRIPLQVSQVNVTANSNVEDAQNNKVGNTGAFSLTADSDYYFTKSFDTWGSIIGVCCVRYRDSYGYSLNRMFTRHKRFDFYFPQFANLGEQPVYLHEMNINQQRGGSDENWPDSPVFGYQEAYADYRTIPDIVCGEVRPNSSLKTWTYANGDELGNSLNLANFLTGLNAKENIDRSLQVESSVSGFQFLAQFEYDIVAVRPMPTYSIPGLVDHH